MSSFNHRGRRITQFQDTQWTDTEITYFANKLQSMWVQVHGKPVNFHLFIFFRLSHMALLNLDPAQSLNFILQSSRHRYDE